MMYTWDMIRAAGAAAFFLFAGLLHGPLWAGSFHVSPVRVELSSARNSDAISVQNTGSEPVVIQLQTVSWSQDDGRDIYQTSDDLVATPPIFTVRPGASQIVRVGLLKGVDETRELSYRLFLQEVQSAPKPGFNGLQMLLRIGLPVFVSPKVNAAPALSWRLERTGGQQIKVSLTNKGSAHVRLWDFKLSLPGKQKTVAVQEVSAYVLPGQSRSWTLDVDSAQRRGSDVMRITADTGAGSVETDVKLETP